MRLKRLSNWYRIGMVAIALCFCSPAAPVNGELKLGFYTWVSDSVPEEIDPSTFPVLIPYGCEGARDPAVIQSYLLRHHRFQIVFTLKDAFKGSKWYPFSGFCGDSDENFLVQCLLNRFEDTKNIMGWYIADEPTLTMGRKSRHIVGDRAKLVARNSRKPVFIEDVPESRNWKEWAGSPNILLTSAYVVPDGDFIQAYRAPRRIIDLTGNEVWSVVQAYAKSDYSSRLDPGIYRFPSFVEIKATAFLALAAGSKGIILFSLRDIMRQKDADLLRDIHSLASELRAEYATLQTIRTKTVDVNGTAVVLRGKARGGNHLLVINSSPKAEYTFPDPKKGGPPIRLAPLGVFSASW